MSHRDSPIKKNKELKKPMDLMNVGFVGAAGGGGMIGLTSADPATSAQDFADRGYASGTYWVTIHGSPYEIYYDETDKFGNGVSGWLKIDAAFIGANSAALASLYQVGSYVDARWLNQSAGTYSLGDQSSSHTTISNMARMRCKIPKMQYAVMNTMTATGDGAQGADDNVNWETLSNSVLNSFIANDGAPTSNQGGYCFAIWNNVSTANFSNGGIIFPKKGAEFSFNGTYTKTFAGGDFSIKSFSSLTTNDPYIWSGTGDSGYERVQFTAYEMWIH